MFFKKLEDLSKCKALIFLILLIFLTEKVVLRGGLQKAGLYYTHIYFIVL